MLMFMSKSSWHIYVTKVLQMIKEKWQWERLVKARNTYIWDETTMPYHLNLYNHMQQNRTTATISVTILAINISTKNRMRYKLNLIDWCMHVWMSYKLNLIVTSMFYMLICRTLFFYFLDVLMIKFYLCISKQMTSNIMSAAVNETYTYGFNICR
jgi:hypothetical protein